MVLKSIWLGALFGAVSAVAAAAQIAPTADDATAAAKNQLGVLEYCQAEGHIDGAALEVQAKLMALLPAASDQAKVDAAYEKGQAGTVSAMGVEQSLTDAAAAQSSDVTALCTQMAEMVNQMGANLPK